MKHIIIFMATALLVSCGTTSSEGPRTKQIKDEQARWAKRLVKRLSDGTVTMYKLDTIYHVNDTMVIDNEKSVIVR